MMWKHRIVPESVSISAIFVHGVTVLLPVPQFPLGFSVVASVRVGNALGAGNIEQAKMSSKVSLICTRMSQICSLVILLASRDSGTSLLVTEGSDPWICFATNQTFQKATCTVH